MVASKNEPQPEPEGEAIVGELVTLDAVQPSAEQAKATRDRAKGRTAMQVFPAAAAVGFLLYLLRLWGVDLNPLPDSEEMPVEQAGYLVGLLGWLIALYMNRDPRAPKDDEGHGETGRVIVIAAVAFLVAVFVLWLFQVPIRR